MNDIAFMKSEIAKQQGPSPPDISLYGGSECVVTRYKGNTMLTPLRGLYDLIADSIEFREDGSQEFYKLPNGLFILDENCSWTKVTKVIRFENTSVGNFLRADNGVGAVHFPLSSVLTRRGASQAWQISEEDSVSTVKPDASIFGEVNAIYCSDVLRELGISFLFRGERVDQAGEYRSGQVRLSAGGASIQNEVKCDEEFGWFVGVFISGGYQEGDCISIRHKSGEAFDRIVHYLERYGYGYRVIRKKDLKVPTIKIDSKILGKIVMYCFMPETLPWERFMNPKIVQYNESFLKGVVGGIIDGFGSTELTDKRKISIRTTSRALVCQVSALLRAFGHIARESSPLLYKRGKRKEYMYEVTFIPNASSEKFGSIKISNHESILLPQGDPKRYVGDMYSYEYGTNKILRNYIQRYKRDESWYGLGTESGTYLCNGMLSNGDKENHGSSV